MVDRLKVPLEVQEAAAGEAVRLTASADVNAESTQILQEQASSIRTLKTLDRTTIGDKLRAAYQLPTERIAAGWVPETRAKIIRIGNNSGVQPEAYQDTGLPNENVIYTAGDTTKS